MRRAALLALMALPLGAAAQSERPTLRLMVPQASVLPQGAPPAPRSTPAPMPDRALEPPRIPEGLRGAVLEPALIHPTDITRGHTFGREHAPAREDRLFQEPAAGARLRVPLQ
jgi:hypothetical protein